MLLTSVVFVTCGTLFGYADYGFSGNPDHAIGFVTRVKSAMAATLHREGIAQAILPRGKWAKRMLPQRFGAVVEILLHIPGFKARSSRNEAKTIRIFMARG
jgi:hypothetical protein